MLATIRDRILAIAGQMHFVELEDGGTLRDIQREQGDVKHPNARKLIIHASTRVVALRKAAGQPSLGSAYGLDEIDGRPVYRYGSTTSFFLSFSSMSPNMVGRGCFCTESPPRYLSCGRRSGFADAIVEKALRVTHCSNHWASRSSIMT